MGEKPAEIERRIAEQRARISSQVTRLQQRMQSDIESVRAKAQEQANHTVGEAKHLLDLNQQVRKHTYSALAAGLGLGVIAGVASESLLGGSNGSGNNHRGASSRQSSGGDSASAIASTVASIIGVAGGTLQEEIRDLIKDGMNSLRRGREGPRQETPVAE